MDLTTEFKIIRLADDTFKEEEDQVVKEFPLKIIVNDEEVVTLACSPHYLDELAAGYLYSEGFIEDKSQILQITLVEDAVTVELSEMTKGMGELPHRIITSGCGRSTVYTDLYGTGLVKVRSEVQVIHQRILQLSSELNNLSKLFKETGGVHNTLLGDCQGEFLIFREDIGRHNAVDKLVGHLVLNDLTADDKILVTTGRISAEMLLKTARRQIPILVSRSAPTDMAIQLAYRLGVTLIGFARGRRMNIYTHGERVI